MIKHGLVRYIKNWKLRSLNFDQNRNKPFRYYLCFIKKWNKIGFQNVKRHFGEVWWEVDISCFTDEERSSKFSCLPAAGVRDDILTTISTLSATRLKKLEFQSEFLKLMRGEQRLRIEIEGGGPGRINLELQQLRGGPRRRMRMMLPQA